MSAQWYYQQNGQPEGPVSIEDMRERIQLDAIRPGHLVWNDGMAAWAPVETTELRDGLKIVPPPPLPAVPANNTMAWILALLPALILASFGAIEWAFGDSKAIQYSEQFFCIVTVLILFLVDRSEVRRASCNRHALSWWLVAVLFLTVLMPGYLYSRAKLLRHGYGYFAVSLLTWGGLAALILVAAQQ